MITTRANETMAPLHDRMPVVLSPEDWDEWLRPGPLAPGRQRELLVPAPPDLLDYHPVSQAVNKALNDGPELVLPCPEEQSPLTGALNWRPELAP